MRMRSERINREAKQIHKKVRLLTSKINADVLRDIRNAFLIAFFLRILL
jgi:hypothetical protein